MGTRLTWGEARGQGPGVLLGQGLPQAMGTSWSCRGAGQVCRQGRAGVAKGATAGWVHLPLGESCFWTHRPRSSSWKAGRQGPQAPDPGGQNSRRCRAQSRLRGHDAAAGMGENRSGGGEGSNARPGLSVAAWRGTQPPWAAPAAVNVCFTGAAPWSPIPPLCLWKAITDCSYAWALMTWE